MTREAIFKAILARKCYATTGAKIVLDVRLDDYPMGSWVESVDQVTLRIRVIGTTSLARITIVKDNVDVFDFPLTDLNLPK